MPNADVMASKGAVARRRRTVVMTFLATLLASLIVASPASAAVDLGVLTLGSSTTLDAATVGETYTYTVDVPASKRLVFSVPPESLGTASTNLVVRQNGSLIAATGFANAFPNNYRFLDVQPAAVDRHLTVSFLVYLAGSLPFTAALIDDPAPVALAWGSSTHAILAQPGQQAGYTIAGIPGHRLGLSVAGSTFPNGLLRLGLAGPGIVPQSLGRDGDLTPGPVMSAGTYTITLDGVSSATGSVDITVQDVVDASGQVTLGAPQTITLGTVWTQYTGTFTTVAGAALRIDVLSSTLKRKDGTPGGATVLLDSPFSPGVLNAILNLAPGTTYPATVFLPDQTAATRTIGLQTDGFSSGSITLRVSAQVDNPPTSLTVGTPVTVPLDVAYNTRSYTVDLSGAPRYRLRLDDIQLDTQGKIYNTPLTVTVRNGGEPVTALSIPTGSSWTDEFVPGNYPAATDPMWTFQIDPVDAVTGTATLLVTPIEDVRVPLSLGQPAVATMRADSDTIVFASPGGGTSPPSVIVDSVDLRMADGTPVPVRLSFEQGTLSVPIDPVSADSVGLSFPAPADLDPTKPWQLRAWVGFGLSGTLSLHVREPVLTRTSIAIGSTTPVRFDAAGDATDLSFTPRAGQRLVVHRTSTAFMTMRLRTADGTVVAADEGSGYLELTSPGSAPLVLEIRQQGVPLVVATGAVTIDQVSDPTVALRGATTIVWTVGQNPLATFSGTKGTRVALQLSGAQWTPQDQSVWVRLRNRSGSFVTGDYGLTPVNGSAFFDFAETLPEDGTYTVVLDPQGAASGRMTLTATAITDIRRSVSLGETTTVKFTKPGQQALLTVEVPRNRTLSWTADSAGFWSNLTLRDASGQTISYGESSPGTSSGMFWTEPLAAGKYTVVIDPRDVTVGTIKLKLTAARS
ncbi:MAG: hypothetical protein U0Q19_21385 [Kineosporiaceae bacterium]